jgi:[acyl-carrier-protein] S-malonyltransferase
MGAALTTSDPDLHAHYLALAQEASGLPVRALSLEGPLEDLTRTDVAQPALFALSLALTEVARDAGLAPEFVAGHSLGEYTSAVSAGALAVEQGMRLVALRGRLMADIQSERPGTMAAVMGLEAGVLAALCDKARAAGPVAVANLNTPAQLVISGEQAAVERVAELAEHAGADQVIRLQVGAAFHSELMEPVQQRLAREMSELEWRDLHVPLVANHSGAPVSRADEVRAALVAQIASPVRWVDCVRTLRDRGVHAALELGPGRVLSGLVRRICPEIKVFSADSREAIERAAERLGAAASPSAA